MEWSHSRVAAAGSNAGVSENWVCAFAFGVGAANGGEGTAGGSGGVFACAGLGISGAVGSCDNAVLARISKPKTNAKRFMGWT